MSLPTFKLLRPRTVEEAVGMLHRHQGEIQICAGGTDLLPSMKQRLFAPQYLMDIRGIDGLERVRVTPGLGVELGALTTLSAVEDSGQQEMLNWFCLAGAMSELERKPSWSVFIESYLFNSNKCFAIFPE